MQPITTNNHRKLYCKPLNSGTLYIKQTTDGDLLRIQSLNVEKHLPVIHQWVNQPYAKTFWQMEGSLDNLISTYENLQKNPSAHSFVAFFNKKLICQADFYITGADELGNHITDDLDQAGLHILMAPPSEYPVKHTSLIILRLFLDYYFSFQQSRVLFGEPDHRNHKIHLLIKRAGFRFLKQVKLSSKTADIYFITRQEYSFRRYNDPLNDT